MFFISFMRVYLSFMADIACWGYGSTHVAQTLKFDRSWGSACRVGKSESEPVERREVVHIYWHSESTVWGKHCLGEKWVNLESVYFFLQGRKDDDGYLCHFQVLRPHHAVYSLDEQDFIKSDPYLMPSHCYTALLLSILAL